MAGLDSCFRKIISGLFCRRERGWETGKLTQGSEDNDGETRMVLKDILEIEHPGFGLECDVFGEGRWSRRSPRYFLS